MIRRILPGLPALLAVSLAACMDGNVSEPSLRPAFNTGEEGLPREVTVCKVGDAGTSGTFSVSGSPAGVGSYLFGSQVTIEAAASSDLTKCKTVWRSVTSSDPTVTLTVTETSATPTEIIAFSTLPYTTTANSATFTVNFNSGAVVRFTNGDQPPPPPGGEGCTPGYWKARQHHDDWPAPYTPSTQFSAVFANAFPGMTLLQVMQQGGGGLNALGRHTVAALLSAQHPDIDNGLSAADVVNAFNAAFASGDYATLQGIFATLNEQDCDFD
jgi:hypothetical protein